MKVEARRLGQDGEKIEFSFTPHIGESYGMTFPSSLLAEAIREFRKLQETAS